MHLLFAAVISFTALVIDNMSNAKEMMSVDAEIKIILSYLLINISYGGYKNESDI